MTVIDFYSKIFIIFIFVFLIFIFKEKNQAIKQSFLQWNLDILAFFFIFT